MYTSSLTTHSLTRSLSLSYVYFYFLNMHNNHHHRCRRRNVSFLKVFTGSLLHHRGVGSCCGEIKRESPKHATNTWPNNNNNVWRNAPVPSSHFFFVTTLSFVVTSHIGQNMMSCCLYWAGWILTSWLPFFTVWLTLIKIIILCILGQQPTVVSPPPVQFDWLFWLQPSVYNASSLRLLFSGHHEVTYTYVVW